MGATDMFLPRFGSARSTRPAHLVAEDGTLDIIESVNRSTIRVPMTASPRGRCSGTSPTRRDGAAGMRLAFESIVIQCAPGVTFDTATNVVFAGTSPGSVSATTINAATSNIADAFIAMER